MGEKKRVMEGKPWVFEGNLFSVVEFDPHTDSMDLNFNITKLWVRMFKLPLACMGKEMGMRLGSISGEVVEVDTDENGVGWGEFFRVRVWIDVTKPLIRGHLLKLKSRTTWIPFQYEKVLKFCFQCGTIFHGDLGCPKRGSWKFRGDKLGVEYGLWLRVASPQRWKEREWVKHEWQ
jgi:hypothetical protein